MLVSISYSYVTVTGIIERVDNYLKIKDETATAIEIVIHEDVGNADAYIRFVLFTEYFMVTCTICMVNIFIIIHACVLLLVY